MRSCNSFWFSVHHAESCSLSNFLVSWDYIIMECHGLWFSPGAPFREHLHFVSHINMFMCLCSVCMYTNMWINFVLVCVCYTITFYTVSNIVLINGILDSVLLVLVYKCMTWYNFYANMIQHLHGKSWHCVWWHDGLLRLMLNVS